MKMHLKITLLVCKKGFIDYSFFILKRAKYNKFIILSLFSFLAVIKFTQNLDAICCLRSLADRGGAPP